MSTPHGVSRGAAARLKLAAGIGLVGALGVGLAGGLVTPARAQQRVVRLPSDQSLALPAPGAPRPLNSFPAAMALSPDGRYLAVLNDGFGTRADRGRQSIAVLNLATGELRDSADPRLAKRRKQDYFLGLAFSDDGQRLYASLASLSDPSGRRPGDLGNGVLVYRFSDGSLAPEAFLPIPVQPLAPGLRSTGMGRLPKDEAAPYPAGLAYFTTSQGPRLLVADNLSDNAVLLDAPTGRILRTFDLSALALGMGGGAERRQGPRPGVVPSSYPYTVAVSADGRFGYCSLWNASRVAVLDLRPGRGAAPEPGRVLRVIPLLAPTAALAAGSHPTALLLSPDGRRLYVALANADRVAVVHLRSRGGVSWLNTELPDEHYGGSTPNALALSADGRRLFVADAGLDAVAVFDVAPMAPGVTASAAGFIPTEWFPTAVAVHGGDLFIAAGKGEGTGPNGGPGIGGASHHPYIPTLLRGSLAQVSLAAALGHLPALTAATERANLMAGRLARLPFAGGRDPIHHVIYIIKENRSYDQVFGDLGVGDDDADLTMYGEAITPNEHALARQFGVLDNFYDSGEVSGDGHVWSMAGTVSDYTEKTWEISYRNDQRTYDYEGAVADAVPLKEGIPDVDEPGTGFIWADVAAHGLTHRNYGEYVVTKWCRRARANSPQFGPLAPPASVPRGRCARAYVMPGQALPPNVGDPPGGPSPWPWPVPMIARDIASKPALAGHFDPLFADFKLNYPDQLRADEFLREFRGFVAARISGRGVPLPQFLILRLPDDHTMGTRPGGPKPEASVADNDLAVGRVVDAVSHSPYWADTAIIILEDDAQNGADHVDAHRSLCLVISRFSPSSAAHPLLDHHFYTTVNALRTMEVLLGLPPMNHNDARAAVFAPLFSGAGGHAPYSADYRNRDNKLIYEMNPPRGPGAEASLRMDWSHADANPAQALNRILWRERKGDAPMPPPRFTIPGLDR